MTACASTSVGRRLGLDSDEGTALCHVYRQIMVDSAAQSKKLRRQMLEADFVERTARRWRGVGRGGDERWWGLIIFLVFWRAFNISHRRSVDGGEAKGQHESTRAR
jgi:hypothetical protein